MPRRTIPDRLPVSDLFAGRLITQGTTHLLSTSAIPNTQEIASGDFVVRYGVRLLEKHHMSIVPGLLALDYGEMLTGEHAWNFLLKRSNLHPRADVLGFRNDGEDDMITVKLLDLAAPFDVLLYETDASTLPIAHVTALIASQEIVSQIAKRIRDYLPTHTTIEAWRKSLET